MGAPPKRAVHVVLVALALGLLFYVCRSWFTAGGGRLLTFSASSEQWEPRGFPAESDAVLASVPSDNPACDIVYSRVYLMRIALGKRNLCRSWDKQPLRGFTRQGPLSDLSCNSYTPPKLGKDDEYDPRTYSFCAAKNVQIVPAEGDDPQDVSYVIACNQNDRLVEMFSHLNHYWHSGAPSTLIGKTKFVKSWRESGMGSTCKEAVAGPIRVFVKRDSPNPATAAQVALAVFDTLLIAGVLHMSPSSTQFSRVDCQIVLVDSLEGLEIHRLLDAFCSYPSIHVSELAGTCIARGIWPISGPGGNLLLNHYETEPCEQVGTYKAFGNFIVHNLGITAKRPQREGDDPIQVLFLVRRGRREVFNLTDIVRSVSCTLPEELVLKPGFDPNVNPWLATKPQAPFPNCRPRSDLDMRLIYMEDHTLEQQITAVRYAHILIAAHGAGEYCIMFMDIPTIIVEIIPHLKDTWAYRNLAKKMGHIYFSLKAHGLETENFTNYQDATLNVTVNEFERALDVAVLSAAHLDGYARHLGEPFHIWDDEV